MTDEEMDSLERFALNSPDMPAARERAILGLIAEVRRLRETRDCVGMLERVGHAKLSHWLRETLELREKVARLKRFVSTSTGGQG